MVIKPLSPSAKNEELKIELTQNNNQDSAERMKIK